MAFEQKIELDVNGDEIKFNVNVAAYNKFQNASTLVNKIQPATNFLMNVVDDSDKKKLKEILQQPGAAMYIVSAVVDEYQPEFNITVKKSNSEQKTSEKTE